MYFSFKPSIVSNTQFPVCKLQTNSQDEVQFSLAEIEVVVNFLDGNLYFNEFNVISSSAIRS